LGDRVPASWPTASAVFAAQPTAAKPAAEAVVALPLGARIKVDPWDDQLRMLKSKPESAMAEDEKRPFEITPFVVYLTRQGDKSATEAPRAVLAESVTDPKP
jgi:hypothetical protein